MGRSAEAAQWYATFPAPSGYDLRYAGIATRKLAELYAALGNQTAAERYRSRLSIMWRDAEAASNAVLPPQGSASRIESGTK